MAESKTQSKFSKMFETGPIEEPQGATERIEKIAAPEKALGRPPGKRSDPAYKQFSVLLKKQTQRQASDILRNQDDGQDLSELLQTLLEQWVKKQSKP
jgi:hypothetical protein